jgi:hypothetical protein
MTYIRYIRNQIKGNKKIMAKFKKNFKTKEQFINFLQNSLIPDLKESGKNETANDFMEAIYWIKESSRPAKTMQFSAVERYSQIAVAAGFKSMTVKDFAGEQKEDQIVERKLLTRDDMDSIALFRNAQDEIWTSDPMFGDTEILSREGFKNYINEYKKRYNSNAGKN